jgi:hypothetical protein
MNERQSRGLDREKLLLRYTTALDAGDFESITTILQHAQQDPELEQMILEINDHYVDEVEAAAQAQDDAVVRELVQTHLLSALSTAEIEPPPLTVGHVLARIHADAALRGKVERDALAATRDLQATETPLPTDLSLRGVTKLLEQLGVQVGRRFQNLFRETAIFMRMGRNQGMARLAATRRQQQAMSSPSLAPKMMYSLSIDEERSLHEAKAKYAARDPQEAATDEKQDAEPDWNEDPNNNPQNTAANTGPNTEA